MYALRKGSARIANRKISYQLYHPSTWMAGLYKSHSLEWQSIGKYGFQVIELVFLYPVAPEVLVKPDRESVWLYVSCSIPFLRSKPDNRCNYDEKYFCT